MKSNEYEYALLAYTAMGEGDRADFETRLAERLANRNSDIWNSDEDGRRDIFRREFIRTRADLKK